MDENPTYQALIIGTSTLLTVSTKQQNPRSRVQGQRMQHYT